MDCTWAALLGFRLFGYSSSRHLARPLDASGSQQLPRANHIQCSFIFGPFCQLGHRRGRGTSRQRDGPWPLATHEKRSCKITCSGLPNPVTAAREEKNGMLTPFDCRECVSAGNSVRVIIRCLLVEPVCISFHLLELVMTARRSEGAVLEMCQYRLKGSICLGCCTSSRRGTIPDSGSERNARIRGSQIRCN